LQNIFTKELPESQIGVYGDYDILIFYRHDSRQKSNYEVKTIRKTFNEILLSTDELTDGVAEKKKVIQDVSFKPTCEFSLKNKHHNDVKYEIQVLGNIEITYDSEEEEEEEEVTTYEPKAQQTQNVESLRVLPLPKLEEEIFQFHGNEDHSIEELMNMDLESLKKISKNH
jgi:hypothetical protein